MKSPEQHTTQDRESRCNGIAANQAMERSSSSCDPSAGEFAHGSGANCIYVLVQRGPCAGR